MQGWFVSKFSVFFFFFFSGVRFTLLFVSDGDV